MNDDDEAYYNEGEEEEGEYGSDYEPNIVLGDQEEPEEPEQPQSRGVLSRLGATHQQDVRRTLLRLHRNLGTQQTVNWQRCWNKRARRIG